MLKEQVARLITGKPSKIEVNGVWIDDPLHEMDIMNNMELAKQILNLFKAEVGKLTVIGQDPVAIVQLQHTKKQLLDLMGE